MEETIVWIDPIEKMPANDVLVLLALTDGSVAEGFWDAREKAWMYGCEGAIYEDEEDIGLGVHHWAKYPKGPKWNKRKKLPPHPATFKKGKK